MFAKEFVVNVDNCTGCNMCTISCKDEHVDSSYEPWSAPQPEIGQFWVDIKQQERGKQPRMRMSYMPTFCQHCAEAPCIDNCADDAIKTRDDGIVWIDPVACTGCGKCGPACPYDVIFFNEEAKIAQKCNGCAHRVDEGLLPRCVEACPHEAILFGDQGTFEQENNLVLKPETGADPRVIWRGLPKPWIAGCVVDAERDEVLSGATVKVTEVESDKQLELKTDEFGDFYAKELEIGHTYKVEILHDGYEPTIRKVALETDHDLGTVILAGF